MMMDEMPVIINYHDALYSLSLQEFVTIMRLLCKASKDFLKPDCRFYEMQKYSCLITYENKVVKIFYKNYPICDIIIADDSIREIDPNYFLTYVNLDVRDAGDDMYYISYMPVLAKIHPYFHLQLLYKLSLFTCSNKRVLDLTNLSKEIRYTLFGKLSGKIHILADEDNFLATVTISKIPIYKVHLPIRLNMELVKSYLYSLDPKIS